MNRKFVQYLNNPDIAPLAIRPNLDLYSAAQVEKFARLIAERLEVSVTAVSKELSELTSKVRKLRAAEDRKNRSAKKQQAKILSEVKKVSLNHRRQAMRQTRRRAPIFF